MMAIVILLMITLLSCVSVKEAAKRPVVIFQAVDHSFLSLWINWWAVAHMFHVVPDHWELHVACIGDNQLAEIIKRYHSPGCSQLLSKESYKKRIYFAKWSAITEAFRQGNDLLVIDLDAVLIRDPRKTLHIFHDSPSKYDVVSSRDHGPAELPYAQLWNWGRFCTGFIFFKYSKKVLELIEFSYNRCDKYGHDQIQFNNALSRSALVWEESTSNLETDERTHEAFIAWTHQKDPDFVLFNLPETDKFWKNYDSHYASVQAVLDNRPLPVGVSVSDGVPHPFPITKATVTRRLDTDIGLSGDNKNNRNLQNGLRAKNRQHVKENILIRQQVGQGNIHSIDSGQKGQGLDSAGKKAEYVEIMMKEPKPSERIKVLLLDRWSILRYCNEAQKTHHAWLSYLDIANISYVNNQKIVSLHCFVETGPLGEQGVRKKTMKEDVMDALNFWLLGDHFRSQPHATFRIPGYDGEIGRINDEHANSTKALLEYYVNKGSYTRMKQVWIEGNFSAHVNPMKIPIEDIVLRMPWDKTPPNKPKQGPITPKP